MNEADIPIHIQIEKLQDFLSSRRIVVDKNWQAKMKGVRDKISKAMEDMNENQKLIALLSGTHINYFHVDEILEILKRSENDSKNIFGKYSSPRINAWLEIQKMYEKDNIYIAEAAQILVRNVCYEIPGIRKQITKLEQAEEECEKRIVDLNKSESVLRNEYSSSCQQIGIKGENIRDELLDKLSELPQIYTQISAKVPGIQKTLNLYLTFAADNSILQVVRHVVEKGNTTVYEYLYSEAPLSIELPALEFEQAIKEDEPTSIDFDADKIDFGSDLGIDVHVQPGEIDWGDAPEETQSDEINYDISLDGAGITVEESGNSGGVARGSEAFNILDSPKYREIFIDELHELISFLRMRAYELNTMDKLGAIPIGRIENVADYDDKLIQELLDALEALQDLHHIKHSNYINTLIRKFQQKTSAIEKVQHSREATKERIKSLKESQSSLRPVLTRLIENTKTLQAQIEADVSKRYKNRIVNLTGGINTI